MVGSLFLVVGLLSLVAIAAGQVGATRVRATVLQVQPAKPGQSDVHLLVRTEDGTTRNVTASSEEPRDYRVGQSVTLSLHRGQDQDDESGQHAPRPDHVAAPALDSAVCRRVPLAGSGKANEITQANRPPPTATADPVSEDARSSS